MKQIRIKNAALQRTAGRPRLLVLGDSSVAFGIDPTVLHDVTGLPTVNLGYDAGCGVLALLGVGDRSIRKSDVVVVQLNADLLTSPVEPTREGRLLAMLYGEPAIALGGTPGLIPGGFVQTALTWLSLFSPTERRMVNDAGRVLLRMPGYRYEYCEIDDNGYFVGKVVLPFAPSKSFPPDYLDNLKYSRPILKDFSARMQRRGAQVFYAVPWFQCEPEDVAKLQGQVEVYLQGIDPAMAVLREPGDCVQTDRGLFTDSGVHLSVEGARRRSRALGDVLNARLARQGERSSSPVAP